MRNECVMDDMASGITDLGAASTQTRGFDAQTELDFPNGIPLHD